MNTMCVKLSFKYSYSAQIMRRTEQCLIEFPAFVLQAILFILEREKLHRDSRFPFRFRGL